ncbi:tetratricopeptide repeat protein [Enterococcus sp. LJL90]
MLEICITQADEALDMPLHERFPQERGIALLTKGNNIALDMDWQMACEVELWYDDTLVYTLPLEFPYPSFDLFTLIQQDLETDDSPEKDKEAFLTFIGQELQVKPKKTRIKKEPKPKTVKKPKPEKVKKERRPIPKKWLVLPVVLLAFVAITFVITRVWADNKPEQPTVAELVSSGEYQEAATLYPEESDAIEQALFEAILEGDSATATELDQFNQDVPTTLGELDSALLAGEYSEAIRVYETFENSDKPTDNARLTLLGYAYLKVDKLDEAEALQEESGSIELEKYITKYTHYQLQIAELEQEISDLEKEAVKNKDQLEEKTNELFDIKEQLANL